MKIPTILLLFSLLNWRGKAAPPLGLPSHPLEDRIKIPTMTPYLQTLAKYLGPSILTLEDVVPIQPLIEPLAEERGTTDGHGRDPSQEIGRGNGHHPNNAN